MAKGMYSVLGGIGFIFQPLLFFMAYKSVLYIDETAPFFFAAMTFLLPFFVGVIFLSIRNFMTENPAYREPGACFDGLLLVGFFQTAYLCLTTYSLQYHIMTIGRYFTISTFIDLFTSFFISRFTLYKQVNGLHWVATGISFIGYALHDFLYLKHETNELVFSVIYYGGKKYWVPFLCVVLSRVMYCFRGVFHKRMLMANHYCKRYWNLNKRLDIEEKIPLNRKYLDEVELPANRQVVKTSALAKWGRHFANVSRLSGAIKSPLDISKNPDLINIRVDEYVECLLKTVEGEARNKIFRRLVEEEVMETGTPVYQYLFHLRNKLLLGDDTDESAKKATTKYKIEPIFENKEDKIIERQLITQRNFTEKLDNAAINNITATILDDTQRMLLNFHLFTGYNDLFLSKLDLMFSSPLFDAVLFDFSLGSHMTTYYLVTAIPYFIVCGFLSVVNNELADSGTMHLTAEFWKYIFSDPISAVVLFLFGFLLAILPFFTFYSIASVSLKKYHWICMCMDVLYVTISVNSIDLYALGIYSYFPHWVFTLTLCFFARAFVIYISDLSYKDLCAEANIELVRAALTEQFGNKEQMKKFINKARDINNTLGNDALDSILLNVLIGK